MKVNLHDLAFLDQAKNILAREICQGIYEFLAEGPGVAHGEKTIFDFFSISYPQATHECSQKNVSPFGPVQPFGQR